MDLRDFLTEIAGSYDRRAGIDAPAQQMLRAADVRLSEHCPPTMFIKGSGGKGSPTFTPWVGFFDPDETDTPQRGIYVVYLFHTDMWSVALSLNQGIEELTKELRHRAAARDRLRAEADAIRARLSDADKRGFASTVSLGAQGFRAAAYEAANILARDYPIIGMPPEATLRADLDRALSLYGRAVAIKRHLLQAQPGVMVTSSVATRGPGTPGDPLRDFKPKSSAEYQAHVTARTITKSRSHEWLIQRYGRWVATRGFSPSTKEHPKDIVIRRGHEEWLTEAKVVHQGNATDAVRAAIGQLFTYRHMLPGRTTGMLAVFSESIGAAYVDLLDSLGIAAAWWDAGTWRGSSQAVAAGFAQTT